MKPFPDAAAWRAACATDPVLSVWAGSWSACFAIESDGAAITFDFVDGVVQSRHVAVGVAQTREGAVAVAQTRDGAPRKAQVREGATEVVQSRDDAAGVAQTRDGAPRKAQVREGATEVVQSRDDAAGVAQTHEGAPQFALVAAGAVWEKFLQPVPPRHHQGIFAMMYRVPEFRIDGETVAFMQHAHLARRVLDIGKWLALGHGGPAPATLAPRGGPRAIADVNGGYVPVTVQGTTYQIYYETAGSGRDVLCMHTAGADGRQFHGLMADARITDGHRLIAFDLPWHGKSPPPEGAIPGSWRLNTELYVDLIMGFIAAAGLHRPIALGASMSGEICLELAYRHPEAFAGIVACEACDQVTRRQTHWASHPRVNQALFVPEWIRSLSAPQSPAEWQEQITWQYGQGGPSVFFGDIAFYSGDWDARDRVGRIDTNRCRLFMLTGEYDYSCTVEMSEATAAKIPGVRFQAMPGIGHFPFAENPVGFAAYLLPILNELQTADPVT